MNLKFRRISASNRTLSHVHAERSTWHTASADCDLKTQMTSITATAFPAERADLPPKKACSAMQIPQKNHETQYERRARGLWNRPGSRLSVVAGFARAHSFHCRKPKPGDSGDPEVDGRRITRTNAGPVGSRSETRFWRATWFGELNGQGTHGFVKLTGTGMKNPRNTE